MRSALLLAWVVLSESEVEEPSEIAVLEDRHDRVRLCQRVVTDLATREPQQLKEDVESVLAAREEEIQKANESGNASEENLTAWNASLAIAEWTKRKMTNCIFNVNTSDIDTFKKPGGGFIALERIKALSTRNMSLPEYLSPKGYDDLEKVLLGKDAMSIVGGSWSGGSMMVYFGIVLSVLGYASINIVRRVTGTVERKKTPKEIRNEEKKNAKKAQ
jgi:hypothetical protein